MQKFEFQLQTEFHDYQEEQHKKQEEEARQNAINKHKTRAKEFLDREAFDEALTEVIDGYSYDQDNAELRTLDRRRYKTHINSGKKSKLKRKRIQKLKFHLKSKRISEQGIV